jgi:DNA-binding MarR family transcriptional regulator
MSTSSEGPGGGTALFQFFSPPTGGLALETLQLVRDLASQIVALVDGGEAACEPLVRASGGKSRLEMALGLLKDRRDRHKFFSATLFGEPVWDILLDLYVRGASNQPTSVTSACIASGVPATTALRYIRLLERQGLVARRADAADARRNFLELSPRGLALLDNYLDEIAR